MSELNSVAYFCPGSCEDVATEQLRDTGEKYFVPDNEDDDDQLVTSPQTKQQKPVTSVAKTQARPEPGTFYSISEMCLSGND